MTVRIAMDVAGDGGEISPLWFGQNIEHTRSCLAGGLSAQLLRNRKFAGMPQRNGAARHWEPIGPRRSWCLLELPGGHAGCDGDCYTRHYDPAVRGGQRRQRIGCFEPGVPAGIAQRGVPLEAGRNYELRLALRADRPLRVRAGLSGSRPAGHTFAAGPEDWTEACASFRARRSTDNARLEITFDGPGNLYVGAASLLPGDHFLGMRADVVDLLAAIGSPLLRWPGGNFAGDYRWQDGLLVVDRRAPLAGSAETLPHTDGFDDHEIGTDEFIALCRKVGAEPFLTINMSLEGPREAAAWVEYCNGPPDSTWGSLRAKRGYAEPYAVKLWTLGNEMGYSHMAGPRTPAGYAELARACAQAMRAVDPSIVLTASTGWTKDWYEAVLAGNDGYFDHVSHHTYDRLIKDFEADAGRDELRRLLQMPAHALAGTGIEAGRQHSRLTLRDMRTLIDAASPPGRRVGIAFDEWNVWYAWYRTGGVAEGLYAAAMLNAFCREGRNVGMTIGAYFQPINEGAILVEPASARLTPVGEVMALFKPHHGRRLLPAELPAGQTDLDVAASLDAAAARVTLTLVNRSHQEAHEVEVVLAGAAEVGPAEGILLSSRDFLPGSSFDRGALAIRRMSDGALAATVPPHSVARLDVAVG